MLGGDDANRAFNQSVTLHFNGPLQADLLEIALKTLIRTTPALRMFFEPYSNQFGVQEQLECKIQTIHFGQDDSGRDKIFNHSLFEHAQHVFDLGKGPLYKFTLLTDEQVNHKLILTFHHVICDGWSLGLICRKLSFIYSELSAGREPEIPVSDEFVQYALRESDFTGSDAYKKQEEYWQNMLSGYMPAPVLPYSGKRGAGQTYRCNTISIPLKKSVTDAVREMTGRTGSSMFQTLSALFAATLIRRGADETISGIPVAGQTEEGFKNLIGHCVSLLPLRIEAGEENSLKGFVSRYSARFKDMLQYKRLSYGSILRSLKQRSEFNQVPLIQYTFNVDRALTEGVSFSGLEFEFTVNPRYYAVFDMVMNLSRDGDNVTIHCLYNQDLFSETDINDLLEDYISLMESCIADDRLFESDQPALQAGRVHEDEYVPGTFTAVHKRIEQSILKYAEKDAVIFKDKRITYAELGAKADAVACSLADAGLKRGDIVPIILDRSPETIISIFGIMKAGGAYLPVDTDYPEGRIEYMISDSQCRFFITDRIRKGKFAGNAKEILIEDCLQNENSTLKPPSIEVEPGDPAYVIYTSGSTGQPKGVILEHCNLDYFLNRVSRVPGLGQDDRLLALTSISFDISILEVFLPYVHGATSVLLDKYERRDPDAVIHHLKENGITLMFATPTHWKMICDAGWNVRAPRLKAISGGEPLKPELADRILPFCESLWNVYGPTETTVFSNIKEVKNTVAGINIGPPIPGTRIYILDENGKRLKKGQQGEIFISGPGVGRAYLNKPELSKERFTTDPFSSGSYRMYRTGDIGIELDNGEYQCLGRIDHQLKIRGYRVEAGEIEMTLNALDDIAESLISATKSVKGQDLLLGYVRLTNTGKGKIRNGQDYNSGLLRGDHPLAKDWRRQLASFLPEFMIPAVFVVVEEWPVSPNGKIDRLALPVPELRETLHQSEEEFSITEFKIARIWEQALGIGSVGKNDHFFDLGGHSLAAIRVVTEIESTFGIRLPISALFEAPRLNELCKLLDTNASAHHWKCLVPVKPYGQKKPLYIVHGGGLGVMIFRSFTPFMDHEQPVFGLQGHGMIKGEEVPDTIEEMAKYYVEEIVRHDPSGPYQLSGFSAGCVVAFEMARQLRNAGKVVSSLVLLDYSIESIPASLHLGQKIKKKLQNIIPASIHFIGTLFRFPLVSLKYQFTVLKLSAGGILRRLGFDTESMFQDKEPEGREHIYEAMQVFYGALRKYNLKPYTGHIDLVLSQIKPYYLRDPKFLGWKNLAEGGIDVHPVNTEHDDLFLPPNSRDFARLLQHILDKNNLHHTQNELNTKQNTTDPL